MQHVPKSAARRIEIAPEFTILEYVPLGEGVSNGTVAEVRGLKSKKCLCLPSKAESCGRA